MRGYATRALIDFANMENVFFSRKNNLNQVTSILKSLLNGHEVSLDGGANDILSQQILHLFTELKRVQSEQSAVSAQANIPTVSTEYALSGIHPMNK